MLTVKKEFAEDIFLVGIFDVHVGSPTFDEEAFRSTVQTIKDMPNAYWFFGGDGIENNIPTSIRSPFEQVSNPYDQKEKLAELTKPIADKCIGATTGNHETISRRASDTHITEDLAKYVWNCPFDPYSLLFYIKYPKNSYTIFVRHGTGGKGSTHGSKVNNSAKSGLVLANCDVYFSGHTHGKYIFEDEIRIFYEQSQSIREIKRHFITGGHYMKYGGYGEERGLQAGSTGSYGVYLKASSKKVIPVDVEMYSTLMKA